VRCCQGRTLLLLRIELRAALQQVAVRVYLHLIVIVDKEKGWRWVQEEI